MGGKSGKHYAWPKRTTEALHLQIPTDEAGLIFRGEKTEVRLNVQLSSGFRVTPTPVWAWTLTHARQRLGQMMVVEAAWRELLMAISEESLANERCESIREFKRYWMLREGGRFPALKEITVFRLRPWGPGDETRLGVALLARLYRDVVPEWAG